MASDDFPKMREFAAKLRSLFMSCPQDVERFQWELVDDRNRVALDLVEPIRWSEPIAPEDDFFAPRGRS